MNHLLKLTCAGLLATTSAASVASQPPDGWYFGLFGTGSYVPTTDFTLSPTQLTTLQINSVFPPEPTNGIGEIKYQFGGGLGGQFGYRWCGFRFEGELLWNYNTYKNLTIGGVSYGENQATVTTTTATGVTVTTITSPYSMSGHTQVIAGLVNVLYNFYNHEAQDVNWMPYIGVGLGYANIKNEFVINYNFTNATGYTFNPVLNYDAGESAPIGQAILGIDYQMDDYFSVGLDYRYLTSKQSGNSSDRFSFHTINFNFNYWFNG